MDFNGLDFDMKKKTNVKINNINHLSRAIVKFMKNFFNGLLSYNMHYKSQQEP